jgi:microcystin-dependent protein
MSSPFIGDTWRFSRHFAPASWNFRDGSLSPLDHNTALFQLISAAKGGDRQTA